MKNDEPPSLDKYLQSFQVTDKLEVLIIEWRPPQGAPFLFLSDSSSFQNTPTVCIELNSKKNTFFKNNFDSNKGLKI